jgi:hypothetical protein
MHSVISQSACAPCRLWPARDLVKIAAGEALVISIPQNETAVIR